MADEQDNSGGIPEWVVTFGDMMSLLLTFFIMLVSLSEVKQDEKYQALVDSVRRQFGYEETLLSVTPGTAKPRNAPIARLATAGRAKRLDVMRGGEAVKAPIGDHQRVRIIRDGSKTAIGTVIFFADDQSQLADEHKQILDVEAEELDGKPQKIEIRGHTSRKPVTPDSGYRDNWDLAYRRCYNTMRYLVDDLGIDENRIRLSVAGSNEPIHIGNDPELLKQNPRTEVFLVEEHVRDLKGTEEEQKQRFTESESP